MTNQKLPAHGGAFVRDKTSGDIKCIRKPTPPKTEAKADAKKTAPALADAPAMEDKTNATKE